MVEIIALLFAIIVLLLAGAALLAAGIYYGRRSMELPLAQSRNHASQLAAQLGLWQEKLLRQTGVGPLRQPDPPAPQPPPRRFVPPSVAIAEMKQEDATGVKKHVPPSIGREFIKDVGGAARPVTRRITQQ